MHTQGSLSLSPEQPGTSRSLGQSCLSLSSEQIGTSPALSHSESESDRCVGGYHSGDTVLLSDSDSECEQVY